MVQYVHITKLMHTLQIDHSQTLRRLFRMECAALTRPSPEGDDLSCTCALRCYAGVVTTALESYIN
jgi:hypothetical protein